MKISYTPIHNEKFCALTCYETCIEDHLPPQYLTIKYIWPLRPNLTTETSFEETFAWKNNRKIILVVIELMSLWYLCYKYSNYRNKVLFDFTRINISDIDILKAFIPKYSTWNCFISNFITCYLSICITTFSTTFFQPLLF